MTSLSIPFISTISSIHIYIEEDCFILLLITLTFFSPRSYQHDSWTSCQWAMTKSWTVGTKVRLWVSCVTALVAEFLTETFTVEYNCPKRSLACCALKVASTSLASIRPIAQSLFDPLYGLKGSASSKTFPRILAMSPRIWSINPFSEVATTLQHFNSTMS